MSKTNVFRRVPVIYNGKVIYYAKVPAGRWWRLRKTAHDDVWMFGARVESFRGQDIVSGIQINEVLEAPVLFRCRKKDLLIGYRYKPWHFITLRLSTTYPFVRFKWTRNA